MELKAKKYQHLIIDHIAMIDRVNVWAGMGMGKTVSTLTGLEIKDAIAPVYPALIIAPKRVALHTWPNEITKWNHTKHLKCSVVIGTPKQRLKAIETEADIYTINYENIPWLVEQYEEWPFKTIVCDESSKLKSFRTRIKRNSNGKLPRKPSRALATIAFKTPNFINLTGTPSPNGIADIWGQNWFIDKGEKLTSSYSKYQTKFFNKVYKDGFPSYSPKEDALQKVRELISPYTISVQPEDWFDLKKPIVKEIEVNLSPDSLKKYKQMEKNYFIEIESSEAEAANAAVKSAKCLQIASGFCYDEEQNVIDIHNEKIEALKSLVNEFDEPLLVVYHWRPDRTKILANFPDAEVLGSDPTVIERWNNQEIKMLLVQPASAGHGLNLQHGGRGICFYSNGWSLEEYEQVIERIGPVRQLQSGYDRNVFVWHIIAKGTLDKAVLERLENKASVQQALLNYKGV